MTKSPKPVSSDDYKLQAFGILNADGEFWTPLAFQSEETALSHIDTFWGRNTEAAAQCRRTHKIIPVKVTIEALPETKDATP